jgi:hypothetical protein
MDMEKKIGYIQTKVVRIFVVIIKKSFDKMYICTEKTFELMY